MAVTKIRTSAKFIIPMLPGDNKDFRETTKIDFFQKTKLNFKAELQLSSFIYKVIRISNLRYLRDICSFLFSFVSQNEFLIFKKLFLEFLIFSNFLLFFTLASIQTLEICQFLALIQIDNFL